MKKYKDILKLTRGLLFALSLLALPFYLQAQDDAETEEGEELITLSAFEVSEDAVRGYATTSSLTASRIAIPITDIAGSVITINEKLIEDTLAVSYADTYNLVSGITSNENSELAERKSFSIRGYSTNGSQRDGIPEVLDSNEGGFDYSMFERIEIIKGPAGVQFGTHNSGGVVNHISKRPLPEKRTRIQAMFGSYNSWRVSWDHSNMMGKGDSGRFGYRIAGAVLNTDGIIALGSETDKPASYFLNPSVSYQFKNGMKVWGWARFIDDQSTRLATNAFIFGSPDGRGKAITAFAGTSSINVQGFNFVDAQDFEGGISHSFDIGKVKADFRLVGRWGDFTHSGDRTRANGDVVFIDTNGERIPDGSRGPVLGDPTRGSVGRFPGASVAFEEGRVVRFGRQGLRYTKTVVPQGADESVVAVDLNLDFKLGPARNKLLLYSQFRNKNSTRGSFDLRVNNSGTLPAEIRQEFGFETGLFVPKGNIINQGVYLEGVAIADQPEGAFKTSAQARDCLTIGAIDNCHQGVVEIWPNPYSGTRDLRPIIDQYAPILGSVNERNTTVQNRDLSNFAVIDRMYFFNDRLIASGGARWDKDDAITTQVLNEVNLGTTETTDETTTYNYGVVVKVIKGDNGEVSFFFNHAETFIPVFSTDDRNFLAPNGDPSNPNQSAYTANPNFGKRNPNRIVATDEFGAKVNLFGSRVVGTFSYFDTVENNVLVGRRDDLGFVTGIDDHSYNEPAGNRTTEGFELDLALNPMPGLNAIVSYGTLDQLIADGFPAWAVPADTFSWLINYEFQEGPLKGFSITPTYNGWGDSQLNRASNFQLPPGDRYDIIFGYRWGKMHFRFRIENLENDIDSQPSTWWTGAGATKGTNYRFGWTYTF